VPVSVHCCVCPAGVHVPLKLRSVTVPLQVNVVPSAVVAATLKPLPLMLTELE
jgi:hypothetical protein